MKDIPIIFSAPMVRALLEGRKTMTRRMLNRLRVGATLDSKAYTLTSDDAARALLDAADFRNIDSNLWVWTAKAFDHQAPATRTHWHARIPYAVGDRLWVREAVAYIDNNQFGQPSYWEYRADTDGECFAGDWPAEFKDDPERPRWKPSIHMPRNASRLTLIVSGVKVERPQDISREDAIAEGCTSRPNCSGFQDRYEGWSMDWSKVGKFSRFATGGPGILRERDVSIGDPRFAFGSFLNHLHNGEEWNLPGKPQPIWDENPFVVAITFSVIKANIDAPEARLAA